MSLRLHIDVRRLRQVLGRPAWAAPRPAGDDSWVIDRVDGTGRVIVTIATYDGRDSVGHDWVHASMSYRDWMPTYEDLKRLHAAVYGDRPAYQVFVPAVEHYNYHPFCLHLWGRADGTPVLPDFAFAGGV